MRVVFEHFLAILFAQLWLTNGCINPNPQGCTYGTGLVSQPSIPPEKRKCYSMSFVWVNGLREKTAEALTDCCGNTDEDRSRELVEDAKTLDPGSRTGYIGLCPCTCTEMCDYSFFAPHECPGTLDYNFMRRRNTTVPSTKSPSTTREITTTEKEEPTTHVSTTESTAAIARSSTTTGQGGQPSTTTAGRGGQPSTTTAGQGRQPLTAYETTTLVQQDLSQARVTFPVAGDGDVTSIAFDSGADIATVHATANAFIEVSHPDRTAVIHDVTGQSFELTTEKSPSPTDYTKDSQPEQTVVADQGTDKSSEHIAGESLSFSDSTENAQTVQTSMIGYSTDQSSKYVTGESRSPSGSAKNSQPVQTAVVGHGTDPPSEHSTEGSLSPSGSNGTSQHGHASTDGYSTDQSSKYVTGESRSPSDSTKISQPDQTAVVGRGTDQSSEHLTKESRSPGGSTRTSQPGQISIGGYSMDQSSKHFTEESRTETYSKGTSFRITSSPLLFKTSGEAIIITSPSVPISKNVATVHSSHGSHGSTNSKTAFGKTLPTTVAKIRENTRGGSSLNTLLFTSTKQEGSKRSTLSTAKTPENSIYSKTDASSNVKTSISSQFVTSNKSTGAIIAVSKLGETTKNASSIATTEHVPSSTVPHLDLYTGSNKTSEVIIPTDTHHWTANTEEVVDEYSSLRDIPGTSMVSRQSSLMQLTSSMKPHRLSEASALTDSYLASGSPSKVTTLTTRSYVSGTSEQPPEGTKAEASGSSVSPIHTSREATTIPLKPTTLSTARLLSPSTPSTTRIPTSMTPMTTKTPNAHSYIGIETETKDCSTIKEGYEDLNATQSSVVLREWTQDVTNYSIPTLLHSTKDIIMSATSESVLKTAQTSANILEVTSTADATSRISTTSPMSTAFLKSSTISFPVATMPSHRTAVVHTTKEQHRTQQITYGNLSDLRTSTKAVLATSSAAKMTVIKAEEQDKASSAVATKIEPSETTADEFSNTTTTTFSPTIYFNSTTPSYTRSTNQAHFYRIMAGSICELVTATVVIGTPDHRFDAET
ncbi:hypothetical protein ANCCAN_13559 [Ancylostoma caninum]|uniref:Peptidase A2 domain-containing protein n=1 Tax=Ancylostoma caninum TaxID=29170 RepID=A0A368G7U4_ANCCA|nr:hypothetical protein ANCCAN_13559 [Ancylostoma caninum]